MKHESKTINVCVNDGDEHKLNVGNSRFVQFGFEFTKDKKAKPFVRKLNKKEAAELEKQLS